MISRESGHCAAAPRGDREIPKGLGRRRAFFGQTLQGFLPGADGSTVAAHAVSVRKENSVAPRKAILWVGVMLGLVLSASPALASAITFSAAGADIVSITPAVNALRAAIGGVNNLNAAGPLATGRREINWDGGGGVTATTVSSTPFNGFQNTRGALFTTPGTSFVQATPGGLDAFFGRGDGLYNSIFDAFSLERVFTAVGSNITDVTFSVPGTSGAVAATVAGFGTVFLDVDTANISSLEFFDLNGGLLATRFVPEFAGDNSFSFLGVYFDGGELIGRVRITAGNQLLGATNTLTDQVALDDFLFAEPQAAAVPEPSSLVLLATAVLLLLQGLLRKKGPFDLPRRWI